MKKNPSSRPEQYTSLAKALPTLLILWGSVFLIINSRTIIAPLSQTIGNSLHIASTSVVGYTAFLAIGNIISLLLSGHIAYYLMLTRTLLLSIALLSTGFVLAACAVAPWMLAVAFTVMGLGGGLYPGSGIALANIMSADIIRGKVLAIHETGPVGAFVFAPIIASLGLLFTNWRVIMIFLACLTITLGVVVYFNCKEGYVRGQKLSFSSLTAIVRTRSFLLISLSVSIAAASNAIFASLVREYLTVVFEFDQGVINLILSLSRVSGILVVFFSGAVIGIVREKYIMLFAGICAGLSALVIPLLHNASLLIVIFLYPFILSAFVPPALSAMGKSFSIHSQGLALSLMVIAVNLANMIYPVVYASFIERGMIEDFFRLLGIGLLCATVPLIFLKFRRLPPNAILDTEPNIQSE